MELDDLKQTWKQTPQNNPLNTDIMELVHQKSDGAVTALKRAFKKQIRLMILVPLLILFTNRDDIQKVLTSVMFWSYIIFCAGIILFSWFNYRIVSRMEGMDAMVKTNLEQQISILENRLKLHARAIRIILIFFIVLTEVLPLFQHYRMLNKWHSLPFVARYLAYATLLILQYFLARLILHRKFGRHLEYLKNVVHEMQ